MERYSRSFRENNSNISSNKNGSVREPWRYDSSSFYGGGDTISSSFLGGLSWPPRSYTCSFCKREFRSAQALGGHMNVHRRDRARLRESPPWDRAPSPDHPELNSSPNPSLIPNLNHPPTPVADDTSLPRTGKVPHATYSFPALLSPRSHFPPPPSLISSGHLGTGSHAQPMPCKAMKALFGTAGEMDCHGVEAIGDMLRRKRDAVRLELEIGLHADGLDEDLDLELRLGYA